MNYHAGAEIGAAQDRSPGELFGLGAHPAASRLERPTPARRRGELLSPPRAIRTRDASRRRGAVRPAPLSQPRALSRPR